MKKSDSTGSTVTACANVSEGWKIPDMPDLPPSLQGDEQHVAAWRKQVRRVLLSARSAMPGRMRREAENEICCRLDSVLASAVVPEKACVGFYWPIQGEIDVRNVVERHIARGGTGALPVVTARHQPMVFHRWVPGCEMTSGFAGIDIPAAQEPMVPDIVLAPLVGFDREGYRLGYGGGFFDRTLAALDVQPVVIGIGFTHAGLDSIFPHPFDVPVNILITEDAVKYF